jgi:FkbM family methyltransferase
MKPEEALKITHEQRQAGTSLDEICIREGLTFKIHEDSRFPYEFFGWRSPEMTVELDSFIKYAKGRKVFLDIGAFHGIFSLVFAKLNDPCKVFAFEPSHSAFEKLKHNASAFDNIRVIHRALSNESGKIKMVEEYEHFVLGEGSIGKEEHEVTCFTGDSFCEDYHSIDTIKIDVEGMELKVLQGLQKTITRYKPTIFLELHCSILKEEEMNEVLKLVIDSGYKIIDSFTDSEMSIEEIKEKKVGELRLVLL